MKYTLGILIGLTLGLATWCALVAVEIGAPTATSQWDAAALDRKAQLAAVRAGPRILVVAGSSGHYGINCAILEARTGRACTNLAVHAGLRLRYTIDYAKRVARPGDIVLIAFEYQVYGETGEDDPILVDYVLARDPRYLRTLPAPALLRFVLSVEGPRLVQGLAARLAPPLDNVATDTTNPFDRDGDELHNQASLRTAAMAATVARARPIAALVTQVTPTPYARTYLSDFAVWCQSHGVTLWATLPATVRFAAYDSARAQSNLARITALYTTLGVPVLEQPTDLFWAPDQFFDTEYHPVADATATRSRALAERLCAHLAC